MPKLFSEDKYPYWIIYILNLKNNISQNLAFKIFY